MGLIAETLVEEWLNSQGFFTIRGLKEGVDEIDLLGIQSKNSSIKYALKCRFHNPVGYITGNKAKKNSRGIGNFNTRWIERNTNQKKNH